MKKSSGFALIVVLIALAVLTITAGGVVVWEKRVPPKPSPTITPYRPSPIPTPLPSKIIGPTVGGPVSPGVFEGDLRQLPTIHPFPTEYYRPISSVTCQTVKDCYDPDGVTPKGVCSSPCVLACINNRCINTTPPGGICLSRNTSIETPQGPIPIQNLSKGTLVWTVDAEGERKTASILQTAEAPVPKNHLIVHFILKDGRGLFASPEHPTASGQKLGNLSPGDVLDGTQVIEIKRVPYQGKYTYDILPAGETGLYWANGILLKSTLAEEGQCQK